MLFVGDIHINGKNKDLILKELKEKIFSSNEKNIIFLGDYVYHFVYDRQALIKLFQFFLELAANGKRLYILAGNHDWINSTFVFEEIVHFLDILKQIGKLNFENLNFIIKPEAVKIEDENVLFLPYNFNLNWQKIFEDFDLDLQENTVFDELLNSTNKNEIYSGYLNKFLKLFLEKSKGKWLVIHHFYTTNLTIGGQKINYKFKDVALSGETFLNYPNLTLISGHIHQSFVYKNYFCTGSVWATSPLETNQFKFIFKYKENDLEAIPLDTNFYLSVDYQDLKKDFLIQPQIDKNLINDTLKKIYETNIEAFNSPYFKINFPQDFKIDYQNIVLNIISNDLEYDDLKNIVSKDLINSIKELKIKRKLLKREQITKLLLTGQENLQESFKSWKHLLLKYLEEKFGEEKDKYIDILREMQII